MESTYSQVLSTVIGDFTIKRAVKYVSKNFIIRVTRSGKPDKRQNIELVVTIGKPNYLEREFIKICNKIKEPFPVKKIQVKHYKNNSKKHDKKV